MFEVEIPYRIVRTPTLEVAYKVSGPTDGPPVILLYAWPSDPHDYDDDLRALVEARRRVYVRWLRGLAPPGFSNPRRCARGNKRHSELTCTTFWTR
jgi:pimeloyl-ACP methyl ester carboxylesterase